VFVESGRNLAENADRARRGNGGNRSFRGRVYEVIDRYSPHGSRIYVDRIPVLAAHNVETRVSISNAVPGWGNLMPSPYHVRVTTLDGEGRKLASEEHLLAPGEWYDRCVSADFPDAKDEVVIGTCILEARPLKRGYRGAARPHFSISTAKATAALHAQGSKGVTVTGVGTIADNPDERQWLCLNDYSGVPNRVTIRVKPDDDGPVPAPQTVELVANGAKFIPLPIGPRAKRGTVNAISIEAQKPVKAHLVITDREFQRLSIDHI
jgi:hypothetical protein